jgi:hypothetical protein
MIYCQATRTKDRGEQHLVLEALAAKGRVGLMMWVFLINEKCSAVYKIKENV